MQALLDQPLLNGISDRFNFQPIKVVFTSQQNSTVVENHRIKKIDCSCSEDVLVVVIDINNFFLDNFFNSYEERARCIREISNNRVLPTTFEDFCSNIFAPNLPDAESETVDALPRAFSAPSRGDSFKDPTSVWKLLDNPDTSFRGRTTSAVPAKSVQQHSETKVCK